MNSLELHVDKAVIFIVGDFNEQLYYLHNNMDIFILNDTMRKLNTSILFDKHEL